MPCLVRPKPAFVGLTSTELPKIPCTGREDTHFLKFQKSLAVVVASRDRSKPRRFDADKSELIYAAGVVQGLCLDKNVRLLNDEGEAFDMGVHGLTSMVLNARRASWI